MSLTDDYIALFASNTGNLRVQHASGYFYVIGEIVLFKCPMLKDEIKKTIYDFNELDWSHLSEQAVRLFFQYLYYYAKFDKLKAKHFVELYDLVVKYKLKYIDDDNKECYLHENLRNQFTSCCSEPFEVLELTYQKTDKTLYLTALAKVQDLVRQCIAKDCCFDNLNPGTDGRPKDYTSYVCCEHSDPKAFIHRPHGWRPMGFNRNLDIVTTPLFHEAKVICYHYTVNGQLPLPADIETSLCCKHGGMKQIKKQNYERFMKLPMELKKAVWKDMMPAEPTTIMVHKTDGCGLSPKGPLPNLDGTKQVTKTEDDDDFVQILAEDAKP